MSDIPVDYQERLNIREQIARIDQAREQALKFMAEQHKLRAEERKLDRDRWLAPWLLLVGLSSGVVVAVLSHIWK